MKNTIVLLLILFSVVNCLADTISGTVEYSDGSLVKTGIVYAISPSNRFEVKNNTTFSTEKLKRSLIDKHGRFTFSVPSCQQTLLVSRELNDYFTVLGELDCIGDNTLIIEKPAKLEGKVLKGKTPVANTKINAFWKNNSRSFSYSMQTKTDGDGKFTFYDIMPGDYDVSIIEEVPQIGCCFNSVVTNNIQVSLKSGEQKNIQVGGTELPCLKGKVTDSNSVPLYGVWVKLESESTDHGQGVYSSISNSEGQYVICDIPPGDYKLICFRRLALNSYSRTLKSEYDITISDNNNISEIFVNSFDAKIDLDKFMPLAFGQISPPINAKTIKGESFSLEKNKGKMIVIYFYASWCSACVRGLDTYSELAEKFESDIVFVGINLDEKLENCLDVANKFQLKHTQIYGGPWKESELRESFRVVNVPSNFVIDEHGKVIQKDIFSNYLEQFLDDHTQKNLKSQNGKSTLHYSISVR